MTTAVREEGLHEGDTRSPVGHLVERADERGQEVVPEDGLPIFIDGYALGGGDGLVDLVDVVDRHLAAASG